MTPSQASSNSQDATRARRRALGPTRTSWTWIALIVGVVLGIALVDFLVQNTRSTEIEFFSASGHVPLTAALLVAALAGATLVLVVGGVRMIQLRRGVRASSATTAGVVADPGISESRGASAPPGEASDGNHSDV
jgi:uncharacterized integral membrane protein